ncbi:MAG: hypothetical protein WCY92_12885 [Novosphingobium sp.]
MNLRLSLPALLFMAISLCMPSISKAQAGTGWEVSTGASGRLVAAVKSTGPVKGLVLACEGSKPMLALAAPQYGQSASGHLDLTASADGAVFSVPVIWNPKLGAWWALLKENAALDMLAGKSTSVAITLNGTALGTLPLTGSTNALRTALASCYAPPAAPLPSQAGATGPSLPIRLGTYVAKGQSCGRVESEKMFIDEGLGGAGDPLAIRQIETIRKTGPGSYVTREDVGVQDNAMVTATYAIPDQEHFTVKHPGASAKSYSYCALDSLQPIDQAWPKREWKRVDSLPIKPGYYRAQMAGDAKCEMSCGYVLIQPAGISGIYYTSTSPEVTRRTIRAGRIVQTGALTFSYISTADEYDGYWFTVHGPTDFTEGDVMMGDTQYRAIDPKAIPARYMPRL